MFPCELFTWFVARTSHSVFNLVFVWHFTLNPSIDKLSGMKAWLQLLAPSSLLHMEHAKLHQLIFKIQLVIAAHSEENCSRTGIETLQGSCMRTAYQKCSHLYTGKDGTDGWLVCPFVHIRCAWYIVIVLVWALVLHCTVAIRDYHYSFNYCS